MEVTPCPINTLAHRAQLGTPALDVLRRAHVAVFGIGGVGGQAVEGTGPQRGRGVEPV